MGRKRVERFENELEVIDINAKGMGVAKTAGRSGLLYQKGSPWRCG